MRKGQITIGISIIGTLVILGGIVYNLGSQLATQKAEGAETKLRVQELQLKTEKNTEELSATKSDIAVIKETTSWIKRSMEKNGIKP